MRLCEHFARSDSGTLAEREAPVELQISPHDPHDPQTGPLDRRNPPPNLMAANYRVTGRNLDRNLEPTGAIVDLVDLVARGREAGV
jgi:hypothetical protein